MSDEKPIKLTVDTVIKEVNQLGVYQLFIIFLLNMAIIFSANSTLGFVMTAGEPNYRCFIPDCDTDNMTFYPAWLENAVPFSNGKPSRCQMHPAVGYDSNCPADNFFQNETEECKSFIFETNERTILFDFGLYCERNQWKLSFVGVVNNVGSFFGFIVGGIFSDKFGRKPCLVVCLLLSTAIGLLRSLANGYIFFLATEFFETILTSSLYNIAFVLGAEFIGDDHRTLGLVVMSGFYALGGVVVGMAMWLTEDWRLMLRAIYLPGILFISYFGLLPESLRWLYATKKYDRMEKGLRHICRTNKRTLSDEAESFLKMLNNPDEEKVKMLSTSGHEKTTSKEENSFKALLKSSTLLLRVANCSFCWTVNALVYFGLSLNSVTMKGNKYFNFILMSMVEIPGYIVTWFIINKRSRRKSIFWTMFISAAGCLVYTFLPENYSVLRTICSSLGKGAITASFTILYIFSAEMFPTSVRQSLIGICCTIGRIGSIMAPMTPLMARYIDPLLVFGGMSLIAAIMSFYFPETLNAKLPDTIEEAERLGQKTKVQKVEEKL